MFGCRKQHLSVAILRSSLTESFRNIFLTQKNQVEAFVGLRQDVFVNQILG